MVNAEIAEKLTNRLMCDFNNRVKEFNLAKLSAYFALSTSSILWVSTPRVCVIKDFFTTLANQRLDWITTDENGNTVPLLDTHGHLVVKHDLFNHEGLTQDGIAEAFAEFAKKEKLSFFASAPLTK